MIVRYEKTRSQEEKQEQNGFPHLPQFPVPMLPHHYQELPKHHQEQIIWTYIPHMKESRDDFQDVFSLPVEERMKVYERMVLGHSVDTARELARLKLRDKNPRKSSHFPHKDIKRILGFIEQNPEICAEDLVGCLSPRVFSRLMLYTKFSGNNQAALRKFFEGLLKE